MTEGTFEDKHVHVSHGDIMRAIGIIEGKMDIVAILQERVKSQDNEISSISSRVSSLERFRSWTQGGAKWAAVIIAAAWAVLTFKA